MIRQSMIAIGNTLPRYRILLGSLSGFLKMRNGIALVRKVQKATTKIMLNDACVVIMIVLPFFVQHFSQRSARR